MQQHRYPGGWTVPMPGRRQTGFDVGRCRQMTGLRPWLCTALEVQVWQRHDWVRDGLHAKKTGSDRLRSAPPKTWSAIPFRASDPSAAAPALSLPARPAPPPRSAPGYEVSAKFRAIDRDALSQRAMQMLPSGARTLRRPVGPSGLRCRSLEANPKV